MRLSRKPKRSSEFFSVFLKSSSSFEHFERKDGPDRWCVSEGIDSKKRGSLND